MHEVDSSDNEMGVKVLHCMAWEQRVKVTWVLPVHLTMCSSLSSHLVRFSEYWTSLVRSSNSSPFLHLSTSKVKQKIVS